MLYSASSDYRLGDEIYKQLRISREVDILNLETAPLSIDFQFLRTQNPDLVGWIGTDGEEINYPLVRGKDNEFYLNHLFTREKNKLGSIFMDYRNQADFLDRNTIIYGHNMKDGSMFADLSKYSSKDFWQAHKTVWFDTVAGSCAYEIFAVIHTTVQADDADAFPFYRFVDAASPEEFADYVSACKAQALYDTGISAQYGDKLLTLSTCDNITDNGRWLVIAKRTETE